MAAIIEEFRAERSPTDIIRFFGYLRSTVFFVQKYMALEKKNSFRGEDDKHPGSCLKSSRIVFRGLKNVALVNGNHLGVESD